jgi:hypothetical protein
MRNLWLALMVLLATALSAQFHFVVAAQTHGAEMPRRRRSGESWTSTCRRMRRRFDLRSTQSRICIPATRKRFELFRWSNFWQT